MKRLVALALMLAPPAFANESIPDQYPGSMLYSAPVEVIPHVWAAIGQTASSTYENAGHNNNLGFIVTGEGVVVVNAGGSALIAEALHDEIKKVTDEPVKLVINVNGLGNTMLGNSYWAEQGVPITSHDDAAVAFDKRGYEYLNAAKERLKDRADGTEVFVPPKSFDGEQVIEMGRFTIRMRYFGPAHSAGGIAVWLKKQRLVFSGTIASHERLPRIHEGINTADWIETWNEAFEQLRPLYVIPGHGHPTNMAQVRRYTLDYLMHLREEIISLIQDDGGLAESYYVDQSPYSQLDMFEKLSKKNASRVYETMEWE